MPDKYAWSENEEEFNNGTFDSIEEALEDAEEYVDPSQSVYIGKVKDIGARDMINVGAFLNDAGEMVHELCGEVSQDFLNKVTKQQEQLLKDKLIGVFDEWLIETKNVPTFFAVVETKLYTTKE